MVRRQAEEPALNDFLDSVPKSPSALVIEGEPGIGKTTLWLDALQRAGDRGFRLLAARAAAAESVLAYTTLADLLASVDGSVWANLPAPQRLSLDAALLRQRGRPQGADARAVAAGFLAVINSLAAQCSVVVAIDDLQWLDTSSANVVSFAARRLPNGAALLCTARAGEALLPLQLPSPDAVRRIHVQPLTVGELHRVLSSRLGASISRPMLLHIHEIAGGNPFYALQLAREMNAQPGDIQAGSPGGLADLVRTRIGRVSVGAEDALLAMASVHDPTVQFVAQAIDTTPERVLELLEDAEAHGVVAVDGNRLRFTHPVLAHGVYTGAASRRRRAMHRRLAELVSEPELHARHLALSDTTSDATTLQALDTAADIARGRGAPAAAAELLELAIGRGGDTPERRIICAARHFDAGDPRRARALLEQTIERLGPGQLRAQALNMLALVGLVNDDFVEAAKLLERALADTGDGLELRSRILVQLSYALFNGNQLHGAIQRAEDAVEAASQLGEAQVLGQALSMRVMMRFLHGDGLDHISLQQALAFEGTDPDIPVAFRPQTHQVLLLGWTGQFDRAHDGMASLRRVCIDNGDEAALSFLDFNAVLNCIWGGRFDEAARIAEESVERARQMGGDVPLAAALTGRAAVAAYAGDEDQTRGDVAMALAGWERCNSYRLREWAFTVLGFLELSLGDYASAVDALKSLQAQLDSAMNATEIIQASFMPDAAEALINLGRPGEALPLIAALERNGRRLDRAWMLAVGARCRAMLLAGHGDLEAATAAAELAMTQHNRLRMPFEHARTQLVLGQLERRQRHRDTATATLSDALDTFERLGTTLWADRARAELARATSRKRRAGELTASEHRVAEMAASGMTNKDIAAALFISSKTVEVNLSRVYRKLNIRSRVELYRMLGSPKE